jgi:hypothetical protein
MLESDWQQFLGCLEAAELELREAFSLIDRDDGPTPAAEHAFSAASSAIEAIRVAERRYYERERPDELVPDPPRLVED